MTEAESLLLFLVCLFVALAIAGHVELYIKPKDRRLKQRGKEHVRDERGRGRV